ncbi:MAG: type IV pilus assembly protein PilM [Planctomycetota bacterium]|nr:type IV pilus assembly protein PilM [Planctomycetota bacterium]
MFAGRFSSSIGHLAVDIGSRGIRLLQVREHQRQLHVVGAARVDLPSGTLEDIQTPEAKEALTQQLQAAVTNGGFTGRRCVVSLPRSDVRLQSIRLPAMPENELRQAALWEASQRFGFDREAMEADYIRTGATLQSGENREEILLVASSHASLHARLAPVMEAGLRPIAVDTDFSALARIFSRCYRRESDQSRVRMVVEVGASGSTVLILRGDQVAFAKSLGISGHDFNQAVAEHLQLDEVAAAELRAARIAAQRSQQSVDAPVEADADRAVFEATRPLIGDLVKEIVLCLRYYGVTFRGHPPERIILSGGDGLEPQLDATVQQACKIPTTFDDELSTLEHLIGQIHAKLHRRPGPASCWAVAAGLSARGLNPPKGALDEQSQTEARRGAA